ncbi:hypothetical protein [Thiomicrorhabdus sp. Milos-T2]|uniref:hypothetical protein n=1 Tax=Thiomicrorhabdus sp. Milos-T2 TaxID=90814 RepID=UPI00049461D2|nr:hypothetical protein [Thiomicrorhabdus sp. Milos-T2]
MNKFVILMACALLSSFFSVAQANESSKMDDRQKLIQEQMELLAKAQNLMQLEIQSHFKRAQTIQKYQMCLQAGIKKDDFRVCKLQLKKDQKALDEEVASLRKLDK